MLNTCKSNGNAESLLSGDEWRTGEQRVGICPLVGDNPEKSGLIPHTPYGGKEGISSETFRYWMSLRRISLLVG